MHLLYAVKVANRQELFTRPATPDADTVTKEGSLELKPRSADRGEKKTTALLIEVPSLNETATEPAEVAPKPPESVLLPKLKVIAVILTLVAFTKAVKRPVAVA